MLGDITSLELVGISVFLAYIGTVLVVRAEKNRRKISRRQGERRILIQAVALERRRNERRIADRRT